MNTRAFASAAAAVLLLAVPGAAQPQKSEPNSIEDLFSEFEAICFTYGERGYSLETTFLIEAAGFKFIERARNGADIYNSRLIQLVIDDNDCAFGMFQLPFGQMLEWTKEWIELKAYIAVVAFGISPGRLKYLLRLPHQLIRQLPGNVLIA